MLLFSAAVAAALVFLGVYSRRTRDEDANAAVDRARTFQREASDLRRKLETIAATTTSNTFANLARASKPAAAKGRSEEKTVRFSDEAVGTGGGRRGNDARGGFDQQLQQQQREELEREVARLGRELQEQREAFSAAEAQGDELQATVEEASCTW